MIWLIDIDPQLTLDLPSLPAQKFKHLIRMLERWCQSDSAIQAGGNLSRVHKSVIWAELACSEISPSGD